MIHRKLYTGFHHQTMEVGRLPCHNCAIPWKHFQHYWQFLIHLLYRVHCLSMLICVKVSFSGIPMEWCHFPALPTPAWWQPIYVLTWDTLSLIESCWVIVGRQLGWPGVGVTQALFLKFSSFKSCSFFTGGSNDICQKRAWHSIGTKCFDHSENGGNNAVQNIIVSTGMCFFYWNIRAHTERSTLDHIQCPLQLYFSDFMFQPTTGQLTCHGVRMWHSTGDILMLCGWKQNTTVLQWS